MSNNKCKHELSKSCCCYTGGLEPNEKCPIHGGILPWPPNCVKCGQFVSYTEIGEANK